MKTIIQIIPIAHDLYAEYKQDGGNFTSKIVCLALMEEKKEDGLYRWVQGMDWCGGEISGVESNRNFLSYVDKPSNDKLSGHPPSGTPAGTETL